MAVRVRAALGLALFAAAAAIGPPSASADASLLAQTSATGVHVTVTQQPASSIITAALLDDTVAYAASDFDTGGLSEALAASAFPGRLVTQGPQLLCSQVFQCPAQPPDYPLLADASYPRRQRDTAAGGGEPMGSGPFVVTPVNARAQASGVANTGTTIAGGASLLAGTPGAITVGASTATSAVRATRGRVQVHVQSVVSDISIAGIVHIASLSAVDDITVAAGRRPVDRPTITLTGVTAAGQAATIDDRGVHVAGTNGPSVSEQLGSKGVSVRTVGVHRSDSRTGARSDATGLQVEVQIPVAGVPYVPNPLPPLPPPFDQVPQLPGVNANGRYVAKVTLGAVGGAAGIGVQPTFNLGGTGQVPPQRNPAAGGSPVATVGRAPAGGDLVSGLAPVGRAPSVVQPTTPRLLGRFEDLLSKQALVVLYAVLALGSAGLFVGWRAAVVLKRRPAPGGRRP